MTRIACVAFAGLAACGLNYAGTYSATYSGTWQNTSPNTLSGTYTDTATVTVTDKGNNQLELAWKVGNNPPSGTILFAMSGASGTATGAGVGGSCFSGTLTNGNTQTTCCETCSVTFTDKGFVQTQAGKYTGKTPQSVDYAGTYTGTWTGTRQ